jgi:excinuclease ABC subunit A
VKLALELNKRDTGRTLYILDDRPPFRRHRPAAEILHQLRDFGNTVIEHNLDVIKTADWLIDGSGRRAGGNTVVGVGTPEDVLPTSHTGHYLARLLWVYQALLCCFSIAKQQLARTTPTSNCHQARNFCFS